MTTTPTAPQSPEEMIENFRAQQKTTGEQIQKLETELSRQKELFVKLQGAIEGIELLHPETVKTEETTDTTPEASPEAVTEEVS